jgi:2-keto-4-pentenoate hydratase/2-oxohepta-3-ene-1,7-dioic acid hydratase in catechol pathway
VRIIRYSDWAGKIGYATEQEEDGALAIRGDIFAEFEVTKDRAQIKHRLAPIVPSTIWCIGLNYKLHAKESGFKIPEYPVLFAKSPSALQIQIPTHLKS